ncbi:MAG TPA: metalloregulator ArsR/SmtB family transcription factor [Anaerolineaceae bacterium]|nr:metalloregulator ArsR/SmtB family transcription factor [Anaerolineaceae bacterium]
MPEIDLSFELELLHERICPALGDPTRMRLLYALAEKPCNVAELTELLALPQSTVSRHLGVLRHRNLVLTERRGTAVFYSLGSKKFIEVLDTLREILREQILAENQLTADLNTNLNLEAIQ